MTSATEVRSLSARGIDIAYEVTGEGPDVIWGHGLTRSRKTDEEFRTAGLTTAAVRLWRYDARGHGATSDPPLDGNSAWDELARDQIALADALGVSTFTSAGASMGCGTSLHVAALAPERLRSLLLVIPPTAWESRAAQAALWRTTAVAIDEGGVDGYLESARSRPIPAPFRGDEERFRARAEASLRDVAPSRLSRSLMGAASADLPPRELVAAIQVPTLIIAWAGDPVHPVSTATELASLISGSRLHVADTADDLLHWPALVRQFLEGGESP